MGHDRLAGLDAADLTAGVEPLHLGEAALGDVLRHLRHLRLVRRPAIGEHERHEAAIGRQLQIGDALRVFQVVRIDSAAFSLLAGLALLVEAFRLLQVLEQRHLLFLEILLLIGPLGVLVRVASRPEVGDLAHEAGRQIRGEEVVVALEGDGFAVEREVRVPFGRIGGRDLPHLTVGERHDEDVAEEVVDLCRPLAIEARRVRHDEAPLVIWHFGRRATADRQRVQLGDVGALGIPREVEIAAVERPAHVRRRRPDPLGVVSRDRLEREARRARGARLTCGGGEAWPEPAAVRPTAPATSAAARSGAVRL